MVASYFLPPDKGKRTSHVFNHETSRHGFICYNYNSCKTLFSYAIYREADFKHSADTVISSQNKFYGNIKGDRNKNCSRLHLMAVRKQAPASAPFLPRS